MEKNLIYSEMLDIYKGLLTEKQVEALEFYYYQDYSLSEIAELMNVSRQGVRDFIKRGESVMDDAEDKLHLVEKFRASAKTYAAALEIKQINKKLAESRRIDELSDEIMAAMKFVENSEVE